MTRLKFLVKNIVNVKKLTQIKTKHLNKIVILGKNVTRISEEFLKQLDK